MAPGPPPLRVGNGAGFWGDNLDAPFLLARDGRLDVLTLEYLAELTLAILSHLRSKDPQAGYVADFPELLERLGPILNAQPGLKIVTNAGGLNPVSCSKRAGSILINAGLGRTRLGVVDGDDVLGSISVWMRDRVDLSHMETGRPIGDVLDRLHPVPVEAQEGSRRGDAVEAVVVVADLQRRSGHASSSDGPRTLEKQPAPRKTNCDRGGAGGAEVSQRK